MPSEVDDVPRSVPQVSRVAACERARGAPRSAPRDSPSAVNGRVCDCCPFGAHRTRWMPTVRPWTGRRSADTG
jgi:hypothetical protein